MEGACTLSLECWRLGQLAEQEPNAIIAAALKRFVRLITDVLRAIDIEAIDFAGRSYDSGMAPEVVEVQEDEVAGDAGTTVQETIAPTLTWRGQVISPGQIVLRRPAIKVKKSDPAFE